MKPKKNPKNSLERYRIVFFEAGTLLALALILLSFEWTSRVYPDNQENIFKENLPDQTELIVNTRPEKKKEEKKPEIKLIINEVPDDEFDLEEPDIWNPEMTGNESFEPHYYDLPDENKFDKEPVDFILVEDKPLFNGGDPMIEFRKYIAMNVVYPQEAINNGVQGRVTLSFVIDVEGNLTEIQVIDSPHEALTKAAVNVIQSSPKWTPGKQRTRPVPVKFYFPVVFRLN